MPGPTAENVRRQATMFLPDGWLINCLRQRFNPEQARLIDAHVTLLREDEVSDWNAVAERLTAPDLQSVTLHFGRPQQSGHLVFLPCEGGTHDFHELRVRLIGSEVTGVRFHNPHITLIHPRNGICTPRAMEELTAALPPFSVTLREVTFIRQRDGGVWESLQSFLLPAAS